MTAASALRPYWAILSARFRVLLQYRAAALAGLGTQIFWGWIRIMIFEAFYRSSTGAAAPMSLEETMTYVWLTQALLLMIPFRGDADIQELIRSGNVAYELMRPLDLYTIWYVRGIALRTAPALLRAAPMFMLAIPFFGMGLPPSPASFLAWLATTAAALLVSSAFGTVMTISLLWTISGNGIGRLIGGAMWLLSGGIMPLPLFPTWAQRILAWLPFRAMLDTPFRVYMGHIPPEQMWGPLAHQLLWAAALILFGRWLLRRGLGNVVVQGG